ncbi:MAG: pilus assembly protein [Lachnospiraceae bacterium]|nr:pilus assembly protein [Lachnospiraceae bacterium]
MKKFMKWKRVQEGIRNDESGMMVVECTISFTIFLMVVIAIIYLTNIFIVHNRIQFAINSAANEVASYSYLYQALGVRGAEKKVGEDGDPYTGKIDDTQAQVIDTLVKIEGTVGDGEKLVSNAQNVSLSEDYINSVKESYNTVKNDLEETKKSAISSKEKVTDLFSDKDGLIAGIVYMGLEGAEYGVHKLAGMLIAEGLTKKYLGGSQADAYLKSYGVVDGYAGLDFSGSSVFNDSGETEKRIIDFVVQYDVDMSFIGFVLPDPKVHVVQRVSVAAWLNGDGQTVPMNK